MPGRTHGSMLTLPFFADPEFRRTHRGHVVTANHIFSVLSREACLAPILHIIYEAKGKRRQPHCPP